MDQPRFDELARSLGSAKSRRMVLKVLLGGALGGVGALLERRQASAVSGACTPPIPRGSVCNINGSRGTCQDGVCVPSTCTPVTSCPTGQNCGTAPDGCGGTLACGTCTAPQTCGGGGVQNQCGTLPSPAIAAVNDGGEVAFFGRSPANELWYRRTSGGSFGPWIEITASGVASRPAPVVSGTDLYVFFRATNNELHYFKRTSSTWGTEQSLGGVIAGEPAAALDGNGDIIVGILNGAGNVFYQRLVAGGGWSGYQSLDGILGGRLDLISYNGDVYLFGINLGGSLWYRQWSAGSHTWGGWNTLGGVLSSSPAAAALGGSLYVLDINPGGVLWYRALSGGSWGTWTSLDGVLSGNPDAAATSTALLAFGTNPAGNLFDIRAMSGNFGAWDPLSGIFATGPVAVTAGTSTYVFGINSAGNTWYRVWDGTSFGPFVNLGGVLAASCTSDSNCAAGFVCSDGTCTCPAAQTVCGTTCANLNTDTNNCGICAHACGAGQSCSGGTCICPAGQTLCSTTCTNLNTDTNNCGTCGHTCVQGQSCSGGGCPGELTGDCSNGVCVCQRGTVCGHTCCGFGGTCCGTLCC